MPLSRREARLIAGLFALNPKQRRDQPPSSWGARQPATRFAGRASRFGAEGVASFYRELLFRQQVV
jgi:hypothetical protein